jgi:hypothetical protein
MKYRNALHYLVGILTALSALISVGLPLVGALMFLVYEMDEDWHIRDSAYHDILEAEVGFWVAVGAMLLVRFGPWK